MMPTSVSLLQKTSSSTQAALKSNKAKQVCNNVRKPASGRVPQLNLKLATQVTQQSRATPRSMLSTYKAQLDSNPLRTKMITTFTLFAAGDAIS